ncbi:MAG: HAMP domain-containing sensor histidine kinase [candidate division Zixibacteria bacterium]|nr:HAMP domain-containing sensor histidine kinase [candidate division Zixibacteria bacterium]
MAKTNKTNKKGLILFLSLAIVLFGQAVWWIAFMAKLTDEKVDIATELGAEKAFLDEIQSQEISRQIMIGLEGVFFLIFVLIGAWLIYRALIKTEELQFHQQNFLMAVTHELKTPLAAIKIYLDSLNSGKISPEKKLEIIPKMKDDVKRLEKMVENILDAGRFDRRGYKLNKSDFDFSILLNDIISEFEKIPIKTKFRFSKNIQKELKLFGDPSALRRAIDAIIENSFKYNDKDQIDINIELFEIKNKYQLEISDNGIGISKKDLNEIFKRFYRVGDELRRNKPGSGLGLYLSQEIIKAHHGKVYAHSDGIGKGTTFIIIIDKKDNGSN